MASLQGAGRPATGPAHTATGPGPAGAPAPPPARALDLRASWQAGPPHLLGDLVHIQLVLELCGQLRKALGTGYGLPTADNVPIALQCWLLTLVHSEDPAQLPRARCACELLQEGGGHQQLLEGSVGEELGRSPNQEEPGPWRKTAQASLPHPLCQV